MWRKNPPRPCARMLQCEAEYLAYACVPFKGQCFPDEGGNQTQMACELVCTCTGRCGAAP